MHSRAGARHSRAEFFNILNTQALPSTSKQIDANGVPITGLRQLTRLETLGARDSIWLKMILQLWCNSA
jgi:hypothetical protein